MEVFLNPSNDLQETYRLRSDVNRFLMIFCNFCPVWSFLRMLKEFSEALNDIKCLEYICVLEKRFFGLCYGLKQVPNLGVRLI